MPIFCVAIAIPFKVNWLLTSFIYCTGYFRYYRVLYLVTDVAKFLRNGQEHYENCNAM